MVCELGVSCQVCAGFLTGRHCLPSKCYGGGVAPARANLSGLSAATSGRTYSAGARGHAYYSPSALSCLLLYQSRARMLEAAHGILGKGVSGMHFSSHIPRRSRQSLLTKP